MSIEALRKTGKFNPSMALVRLGETALMAKAHADLMAEKVGTYQRQILADGSFRIGDGGPDAGKPIFDPDSSYRMAAEDFARYLELCQVEQDKAGLKALEPDHCPALEAQHLLIQAEVALRQAFAAEVGEPGFGEPYIRSDLKQKLMQCIYSLLSPKMAPAATIMQRLSA